MFLLRLLLKLILLPVMLAVTLLGWGSTWLLGRVEGRSLAWNQAHLAGA